MFNDDAMVSENTETQLAGQLSSPSMHFNMSLSVRVLVEFFTTQMYGANEWSLPSVDSEVIQQILPLPKQLFTARVVARKNVGTALGNLVLKNNDREEPCLRY